MSVVFAIAMRRSVVGLALVLLCALPAAALEVLRVRVPPVVTLTDGRILRSTRPRITVRNDTAATVEFANDSALGAAVGLVAVASAGDVVCPSLVPALTARRFPVSVRAGHRRTVRYRVDFVCGANPGRGDVDWTFNAGGASATTDVVDQRATTAYQLPGRYAVGTASMTLVDASRPTMANGTYAGAPDRTLPTLVWYPAAGAGGAGAPVAHDGAPFPFVVFSHGLGAPPNQSTKYTTHLASHGYVVIAPAYPLSKLGAPGGPSLADAPNQAGDVSFLIDTFLARSATTGDPFAGAIDPAHIAATGHSNGGLTTLIAAYDQNLRDARITAAIPMSPPACWFQPGYFDGVTVPLLLLHGDNDLLVNFASNALPAFGRANPPKSLVRVRNGNHLGFADVGNVIDDLIGCATLPSTGTLAGQVVTFLQLMGGDADFVNLQGCTTLGCSGGDPTHIAGARQMQIAKQTATAFLEMLFRNDAVAERYVYEELAVTSPDVEHTFER